MSHKSLQTPLARARGLGSAKDGTEHWWHQRLTSLALVPLGLWFTFSVASLSGAEYDQVRDWIAAPWNTTFLLLFIFFAFHHMMSGIEVIVEDYVHNKWAKMTTLILQKFFCLGLGVACSVSVLTIAFGK